MEKLLQKAIQKLATQLKEGFQSFSRAFSLLIDLLGSRTNKRRLENSEYKAMNRDISIEQATHYAKIDVFESWSEMSVDFIGLEELTNEDYFMHDGSMSRPGPVFGRYFDFNLTKQ